MPSERTGPIEMDQPSRPAPFSLIRSSLALGLVAGMALLFVLALLELALGGRFVIEAGVGAGLSFVAAVIAQLPVWLASRKGDVSLALHGVLAGLVARLGLTTAGIVVLVLVSPMQPLALAASTLGWYVLLLLVEIALLYRFLVHAGSTSEEEVAA